MEVYNINQMDEPENIISTNNKMVKKLEYYLKEPNNDKDFKNLNNHIKKNPEKAAKILSEAPVTSVAMNNVKKDSQKLIRLFRGERANAPGTMAKYIPGTNEVEQVPYSDKLKGRFFTTNEKVAKQFADDPSKLKSIDIPEKDYNIGTKMARRINVDQMADQTILPKKTMNQIAAGTIKYNADAGTFVNTQTNTIDNNFNAKNFAEKNPVEVKAGTEDALKPIKGNLLKTVGKSLAYVGAPLPTALIDSYFVGKQISEDKSAVDIAKDPLNWLGLATMSTLSEISGVTKPGKLNAALRLGMSPGLIRGVSRFAGIPGLAISTALTAYDQYEKYKNEEGLIYNLFNDKAKAV